MAILHWKKGQSCKKQNIYSLIACLKRKSCKESSLKGYLKVPMAVLNILTYDRPIHPPVSSHRSSFCRVCSFSGIVYPQSLHLHVACLSQWWNGPLLVWSYAYQSQAYLYLRRAFRVLALVGRHVSILYRAYFYNNRIKQYFYHFQQECNCFYPVWSGSNLSESICLLFCVSCKF